MPAGWAAAASVAGAYLSSQAAGDAADQQAQSGRESNALSERQFQQTRADNAGVRARGDAAGSRLSQLLGLSTPPQTRDQLRSKLISGFSTPGVAGSQGVWNSNDQGERPYGAGYWDGGTAGTAGSIDEAGLNSAIDAQLALDQQQRADPAYGSLSRNFSASDREADPLYSQMRPLIDSAMKRSQNFETAPGYEFRKAEGAKSVENSAAARGGLLSGPTIKAMQRFGQDFASNEYGNWFNQSNTDRNFISGQGDAAYNRFNTNNNQQYNRLAGVAGSGQTATNNVNAAGQANAFNQGNTLQGIGNAQAAGTVGQANAWSNGLSQAYNGYQNNQLMQQIQKPQSQYRYTGGVGYSADQGF